MTESAVEFPNREGHVLSARLDLPPDGDPVAWALFAHCFTCSKNLSAMGHITRALAGQGIATMRFDFTGLGESEGDFSDTRFSSNVEDIVAASAFMREHYSAPEILIGHSLGGAAMLRAAGQIDSAVAVATIAAPASSEPVRRLIQRAERGGEPDEEAETLVDLDGRSFRIHDAFLEELDEGGMADAIENLGRALLVMHGPLDRLVGIDNAARIFEHAKHPKSFVSLDEADHLLSDPVDSAYAGAVIAAWSGKYVETSGKRHETRPPEDNRIVSRTGREGFRTEIMANGHSLVSDEPLAVGGTNTGPTPYNLLAAALGACTGMTLRMYADRKKWPLEGVTVRLKHSRIHASDCRDCEEREGRIDHLHREIELEGPLDDAQRQRLVEIAGRCPVHQTLQGDISIETVLRTTA